MIWKEKGVWVMALEYAQASWVSAILIRRKNMNDQRKAFAQHINN